MPAPLSPPGATRLAVSTAVRASSAALVVRGEARVDRFDEHLRGPGTGISAEAPAIWLRRIRGLHLVEPHSPLLHVIHDIAHDGDHVAVFDEIWPIAKTTVSRDYVSPVFEPWKRKGWNRKIDQLIQRVDLPLDGSASCQVDDGKPRRVEHVTRDDDVVAAEEDCTVAVRMGVRQVDDLDSLAIHVHGIPAARVP